MKSFRKEPLVRHSGKRAFVNITPQVEHVCAKAGQGRASACKTRNHSFDTVLPMPIRYRVMFAPSRLIKSIDGISVLSARGCWQSFSIDSVSVIEEWTTLRPKFPHLEEVVGKTVGFRVPFRHHGNTQKVIRPTCPPLAVNAGSTNFP